MLEAPLPGQADRAPTEVQLESEYGGFASLLAAQGKAV